MHPIFQIGILLVAMVSGCSKLTVQGFASRKYIRNSWDSIFFNGFFFGFVALSLFIIFPMAPISTEIFLWGLVFALCTLTFQTLYLSALNSGPVSLTVLIVNFNVLIPTVISVIFFHETVYLTQCLGIVFFIISMLLSGKKDETQKKATGKWLIFSLLTCLFSGFGGVIQKFFGNTPGTSMENASTSFLILNYVISSILAFILAGILFLKNKKNPPKVASGFAPKAILFAIAMGIIICLHQKLTMFAIANIDGVLYFPSTAGLQSMGMTLIGVFLFKDKLSFKQKLGLLFGISCTVLMNLKIGIHF